MLKYSKIINRLTDTQKILLLTNAKALGTEDFAAMGIPKLNICAFEQYAADKYPSAYTLANSWDRELIRSVSEDVTSEMSADGVDLALTVGAKVKLDPRSAAISEDTYLSSELSGAYLEGAKNAGLPVCMTDLSLSADETAWMDTDPDERIISEFVIKPYADAIRKAECCAVMAADDIASKRYDEADHMLTQTAIKRVSANFSICGRASAATTVKYLQNGVICLEASEVALESAMRRYEQIKRAVDKGSATDADLETEISKGKAISPEAVDQAIDRLLTLAYSCDDRARTGVAALGDRTELTRRATYESAVLLKNDESCLPLSGKRKFSIIGDMAFVGRDEANCVAAKVEALLTEKGYSFLGSERGYDSSTNRSERMINGAMALATGSDIVLLFLGFDEKAEKRIAREQNICLPANQCALANNLRSVRGKVVAIVSSNYSFDISAVEDFDAVMLVPYHLEHGAEAVVDILTGAYSPVGRLSNTLYRNTEHSFEKQMLYLHRGMKAGPFVGYRYYDTADYNVGYPFGHGLGYAELTYSSAKIKEDKLYVTVKNTGKVMGETVVQVYAGIKESSVIRPKKELIAFERVRLDVKESKTLQFDLTLPTVYDPKTKKYETEDGEYTIYVGESVSDIRLSLKMYGHGVELESDGAQRHKYLQSVSNIISDNYTLEANYKLMKRSVKNIVCGSVLLALAVSLQVYCSIAEVYHLFLQLLSAALVIIGVVLFIHEIIERKRIERAEKELADKENAAMFNEAEELEKFSTEQMFNEEFDMEMHTVEEQKKEADLAYDSEYFNYVDKDFGFADAAREFEMFASEHGAKFDTETVKSIFAAMASSRMLITNGMDDSQFKKFTVLLGEYFETTAGIDRANTSYTSSEALLFSTDEGGTLNKTAFHSTIETAKNVRQNIHISAFTGVTGEMLENCFGELVRYAKNPTGYNYISMANEQNVKTAYYIPQNMWIFINTDATMPLGSIPADIAEVAVITKLAFTSCEKVNTNGEYHKFKYYQMDYLTQRVTDKFEINEGNWKKVDKLVAYVNKCAPFSIGNKQWVGMEKYASAFSACGGDISDAIDRMLSVKAVASMLNALSRVDEKINLGEALEEVFGEGNVDISCKTVRESEKNRAQDVR